MARPVFSGHETFACKSHWLKRGYEFVRGGKNFSDDEAVVHLGVGKNMVSSIRFWMKAFGILDKDGQLTNLAYRLLDEDNGYDPYFEDLGTLWLMHFNIVNNRYATVYWTTFIDYHRSKNLIEKDKLKNFIKTLCFDSQNYHNLYNENTVRKDINVLIHNYFTGEIVNVEDSNTILSPLDLLVKDEEGTFRFNYDARSIVPTEIFLYALLMTFPKDRSISFDEMKNLSLMFCLTNNDLLEIIKRLCDLYPGTLVFSDVAGIKELQIKGDIQAEKALENYYIRR